jgi:chaperone modulatory protein CbpM
MTFTTPEFLERSGLDEATLEVWIEEEWIIPRIRTIGSSFSEVDLARARLIHDLTDGLGVNPEGVGVVLRLIDQIHGLRSALAACMSTASGERHD